MEAEPSLPVALLPAGLTDRSTDGLDPAEVRRLVGRRGTAARRRQGSPKGT